MEWSVLNWNEPAIRFYRGIGAQPMDEWTVQRLTGRRCGAGRQPVGVRQRAGPCGLSRDV